MSQDLRVFNRLAVNIGQLTRINEQLKPVAPRLGEALEKTINYMQEDIKGARRVADELVDRLESFPELVRAMSVMNTSLEPSAVLEDVMKSVIELTGSERAYLMLLEDGELRVQVARHWDQATLPEHEVEFSLGVVQMAVESKDVIYTANAQSDSRFSARSSIVKQSVYSVICIPLLLHGEVKGVLYADKRVKDTQFSPDSLALLAAFANQAAIAIENARLFDALRRSRERIVTTREEERRRMRRDLHDGLGAALSGAMLGLDGARVQIKDNPDKAEAMLAELKADLQETLASIRRLIYGLRPPALDELGLIEALRGHSRQFQPLRVVIEAPPDLPALSAALEVALYRIAAEAMTNIVRHAEAQQCIVRFRVGDNGRAIVLEVRDDGRGISPEARAGVGMASMQERAEELGGELYVESLPEGGTCVTALIPLGL